MNDLLYFENDLEDLEHFEAELRARGCTTERDYDEIHHYRLSVDGMVDANDYYVFLMERERFYSSLTTQLLMMSNPEALIPAFEMFKARNPQVRDAS